MKNKTLKPGDVVKRTYHLTENKSYSIVLVLKILSYERYRGLVLFDSDDDLAGIMTFLFYQNPNNGFAYNEIIS